jgi:dolichol kinase
VVGWGDGKLGMVKLVRRVLVTTAKAAVCAAGASLNEAVLTGGNDNVVVPVVLWVLVRGVGV